MNILLITDIFGVCESTDNIYRFLNNDGHHTHIVDPYQAVRHAFASEDDAYRAFISQCGHDTYFSLSAEAVSQTQPHMVIGFSAGANVAWRLSGNIKNNERHFVCFYPSRIYKYLQQDLMTVTDLVLPFYEPSFDVVEIANVLKNKDQVRQHITPFSHGFMNQRSVAYDSEAANFGLRVIKDAIEAHTASGIFIEQTKESS
ncbi:dienelactone hydrolase family protein [Veronia pacifica]|uniref:Uncharacterized protein n=1 Tax=Veronia pacifica TaxID=1080227 RepID=A0A1C3ESA2_9GAMM|nr:dienelactone hydrolase family protein [Veronia pacifica]ODA36111.1 hypothetical protein A8L45_00460 [Veronia pacifica]